MPIGPRGLSRTAWLPNSDARTMDQATAVLQLPAPLQRPLRRPARASGTGLPPGGPLRDQDTRKVGRDNTVKYHWRVLQLLPDRERTSYAGLRVEVLERPNGQLIVRWAVAWPR